MNKMSQHEMSAIAFPRGNDIFIVCSNTPLLPMDASAEEKEAVFTKFLAEGKSAFQKYQVVYLKGISIPEKYEDLLKPEKKTNYSDVSWVDSRPSNNNFSLSMYNLSEDEKSAHALDIRNQFTNAVLGWM